MGTGDNIKTAMSIVSDARTELETVHKAAKEGKLQVGAVVRLIALVLTWVNQIAVMFDGYNIPNLSPAVTYIIAAAITVVVTGYSYWKNNSWTSNAKTADAIKAFMTETGISADQLIDAIGTVVDAKSIMDDTPVDEGEEDDGSVG